MQNSVESGSKYIALESALAKLSHITLRLRAIGIISALLTIAGLISYFLGRMVALPSATVISLPILSLLLLVLHDDLRKRGQVIYSEITDELHWNRTPNLDVPSPSINEEEKVDLTGRIIISSFVQSADLPLLPGRAGYLGYALINLALPMLVYFRYVRG